MPNNSTRGDDDWLIEWADDLGAALANQASLAANMSHIYDAFLIGTISKTEAIYRWQRLKDMGIGWIQDFDSYCLSIEISGLARGAEK